MKLTIVVLCILLASGCIDFAPCAAYLEGHTKRIVEDCQAMAKVLPEDSPAVPILENIHWRADARMRTWATEFRRAQAPLVIDVPKDSMDNRAMLDENRALDELTRQIDEAAELPFGKGGGGSGILGLLGLLGIGGGTTALGVGMRILKKILDEKNRKVQEQKVVADKAFDALNLVKSTHRDAVISATQNDPILKAAYRQRKAEISQEELRPEDIMARLLKG